MATIPPDGKWRCCVMRSMLAQQKPIIPPFEKTRVYTLTKIRLL